MRYIILFILIFSCSSIFGQNHRSSSAVHLKNGSIYVGDIVESAESFVRIQIGGGSIFMVNRDEILKIEVSDNVLKQFKTDNYYKEKRFVSYNSMSFLLGVEEYYFPLGVEFRTSNGYKFNRYLATTMSLGTFFLNEFVGTSLGARATSDVIKGSSVVNFVALEGGWGFSWDVYDSDVTDHNGGVYTRLITGVRFLNKSSVSLSLHLGYTYRQDNVTITDNWPVPTVRERKVGYNRMDFGLGINF